MSMEYKEALKVVQEDVERLEELKEACEIIMTLYDVAENSYHEGLEDGQMVCDEKWIPCSERLPEEDGCYLVTTTGTNNDIIDIAYYTDGIWHKASRIKAWMPLPEPYKEGDKE